MARLADAAPLAGDRQTLWRTLQTFNFTRVAIALVLLAYLSINAHTGFWLYGDFLYRQACGVYLALAVVGALTTEFWRRRFLLQLTVGIAVDLLLITALYVAAGGAKSGLAILYLFPLAGGAVLAPTVLALFFTALVALTLLLESTWQLLNFTSESTVSQAGLFGAAFFAASYLLNRLAARLLKQERLAVEHGTDLRVQQAINQLVIADMRDGVLVLGPDMTVLTANPAAERLLGLANVPQAERRLARITWLAPIAQAHAAWSGGGAAASFVMIKPAEERMAHLRLRFASVDAAVPDNARTVVFMQDVSEIENRAQELKLASMGRLTASIAHEVRNPLSAIGHANSLLIEDAADPVQLRLLNIIHDNVGRLNRMIEDILRLSRKAQTGGDPVSPALLVPEIVEEFRESQALRPGFIHVGVMDERGVLFDPLHLREVIVNLLSNALRYASGRNASIRLFMVSDAGHRRELHVQDDGAAITPEVRSHLFEPFYTTSRKGTGLGLYLARELCLNNGATLDYEYRTDSWNQEQGQASGRFVITLAAPDAAVQTE